VVDIPLDSTSKIVYNCLLPLLPLIILISIFVTISSIAFVVLGLAHTSTSINNFLVTPCQGSFAVKSYFCIYVGTTQPVILPVTPQHGPSTVFMCSIGCDPYGDSILLITLSISSPKVAKNDINAVFFYLFSKPHIPIFSFNHWLNLLCKCGLLCNAFSFIFTLMKKNTLYWLCQIGGWFLFVLLEFIGYGNIYGFNELLILNVAINFVAGITLTHLYRIFIIKTSWINLPIKRLLPIAILGIGFVSFLLTMLNIYLDRLTVPLMSQLPIDTILIFNYLFNWSKYILLWALVYHLFQYWERSLEAEKAKYQLQAIIKENQYQNLKTQLNPHFLFNSLNSIRTLVDIEPELSKEAINRLSSLLRNSLQMSREKVVSMKQELETVNDYLAIEKIRFDDRLTIKLEIDEAVLNAKVPPMMLQTLVENAVKHGISKSRDGGLVQLKASQNDTQLLVQIINTGRFEPNEHELGFGVENTRQRLAILFEDRASFSIENLNDKEVITKIILPL